MRKIFMLGALLIAGLAIIALIKAPDISRLMKVNSLFDEDKIVGNFSNMKDLLYSDPLPRAGTEHIWPEDMAPLPQTFSHNGTTYDVQAILDETKTTALVVVKDGTIVQERYLLGTSAEDKRISWSMSKSFVSALFGIAVQNGEIDSLDDHVTKYAPSLAGSAYEGASIRNVLHMASGIEFNEDYLDPNSDINKMGRILALGGSLDDFAAAQSTRARPPGSGRQYCSIDTHVLSMVLRSATGQKLQDYFVDNLWSKIGASDDAYYSTDSKGNAFALGGLNMKTRDYALFGELMRNGGARGDEQIIPAAWAVESTQNSAPADVIGAVVGYGYQWWVPPGDDGDYFAVGIYGQYIYISPKTGVVIAKNSAHRDFMNQEKPVGGHMLRNISLFRAIADHYGQTK